MRSLGLALSVTALVACTSAVPEPYVPAVGDVVFQSLPHGPLVDAIEGASRSPFSHCGIVVRENAGWVVMEAFGTVHETPLDEWVARGREGAFAVYRWSALEPKEVDAVVAAARQQLGRPYDFKYEFGNEAVYCSELVFVACREVLGRSVGATARVGELNWEPFEAFILELEGGEVPLERELITPQALADASELTLVYSLGFPEAGAPGK